MSDEEFRQYIKQPAWIINNNIITDEKQAQELLIQLEQQRDVAISKLINKTNELADGLTKAYDILRQLDIKSDVVQAKRKFSKSASKDFNKILERKKGVATGRQFSAAEARKIGSQPNIKRFLKSLYIQEPDLIFQQVGH